MSFQSRDPFLLRLDIIRALMHVLVFFSCNALPGNAPKRQKLLAGVLDAAPPTTFTKAVIVQERNVRNTQAIQKSP